MGEWVDGWMDDGQMERWMDYGEKMLDKVGGGRVLNKEIKNVKFSLFPVSSL